MRVAFLTHEPFYPPSGGGSAEAIYLVKEWARRGDELHLFCPVFADASETAARFGIRAHLFDRWPMGRYTRLRNLKYLLYPSALARLAHRTLAVLRKENGGSFRFDVLVSQHTISGVAAGNLRRKWGVPAVLNYLDYLTGFMETWPAVFTRTGFVKALNRFEMGMPKRFDVEGVMTVSTPLAERFIATGYPSERVRPIQYGYDSELFAPSPRAVEASEPVVLMHGSFDKHHIGPVAFGAVERIFRSRPRVVFRFVGRVTETLDAFAARLRAQLPGIRLELPGFVPYSEIVREIASATVGIVPYEESQGVHCAFVAKAVEYLACGIPVASTPLENLRRYFVKEPAVRFSNFDSESLAREVEAWLDTPVEERRRLGLAAADRVRRKLDWRVIARTAADFVEERAAAAKTIGKETSARN